MGESTGQHQTRALPIRSQNRTKGTQTGKGGERAGGWEGDRRPIKMYHVHT